MKLTLPWSALASSNTRNQRRGGKGHSWAYKRSRDVIHTLALMQCPGRRPRYPSGDLAILLDFYPPDRRKRDCSNLFKVLADSLQGVIYADDYQLQEIVIRRQQPDQTDPRVVIAIEEAP